LLREQISKNANSAYGKALGFGKIKNYQDFVRRVPMVNYDDLVPWIQRIRKGETRVLTSEPVTHLIPTGGSSGARKLIPFTAGLQREFDRAISPWIVDLVRQHPGILLGPAYWSITPPQQTVPESDSAVPIGFADDASYLGGVKRRLIRASMVVPATLDFGMNLDAFRFETLFSLLRERDLRLISVWHPSFLTLLLDALPSCWNKLLARISATDGCRARELKNCDSTIPESLWPHLHLISCWGDSHGELPLAELRQRFPNVPIQPKGLLATEAVVSIPMRNFRLLAIRSHFFEFIDQQGRLHRAHELRQHETYEVVVTTSGGLWRYRLQDQVQVTGFLNETPSLRFIGRIGNVSDLSGEKLTEAFAARAIQEAMNLCNAKPRFALLAPENDALGWRYTLYAEGMVPAVLAELLENSLRQNPHYANCRDLGQLQPVRIFNVASHGYECLVRRLTMEGKRLGEIKPMTFSRLSGWSEIFVNFSINDTPAPSSHCNRPSSARRCRARRRGRWREWS
jgi:hypothetical protein